MSWRQPYAGRITLALIFAVAFLANGGLGLWVGLASAAPHVNGLSAVVTVFGLVALAGASQQMRLMSSPLQRGRGTPRSGVEGAFTDAADEPPPSAAPPPPLRRRGGETAPAPPVMEQL